MAEAAEAPKKEDRKRCSVCHGRGYIHCDCWPGDCICGYGDEECEFCDGHGWFYPDEDIYYEL